MTREIGRLCTASTACSCDVGDTTPSDASLKASVIEHVMSAWQQSGCTGVWQPSLSVAEPRSLAGIA